MLPPASLLGVLFALLSAAVWGGGDFTGGLATRRSHPFHVLALSSLSGMVILMGCVLLTRESFPSARSSVWAALAGVGFGAFFILLGQVEPGKVFTPLLIARFVALGVALLMIAAYRLPLPALTSNPTALLAGVLDAGGNVFYVLAKQHVRLDVAAVLASLYPVTTVMLAHLILHERISRRQWGGVLICPAAIVLIST